MRFDEIELQAVPLPDVVEPEISLPITTPESDQASLVRRLLALITDLSLFVALALALTPLLPAAREWWSISALGGFVLMTSYYYFVGAWLLWGKTIGGAIFDVKVVSSSSAAMSLHAASVRWIALCASLLTGGIGFAMAVLPDRRSLPDRLSRTRCIATI